MRVTRRQLRRIIKEEKLKLRESWGESVDTGSPLIAFAQAYASLGNAVQEQVNSLVLAYMEGGFEPEYSEVVYEQNPAAIDMAMQRLRSPLTTLGQTNPDAEELLDALETAEEIYRKGDAEVEADAAAAGDRPTSRGDLTESLRPLREADTDVYEGDHDPIRIEIPALEKIAPEKDFDGKKVWFGDSDAIKIADMLEDGPPNIERYDYDQEEYDKATAEWDEIDDLLDGWGDNDREELAKNIRDGIKQAEDAGYEY